MTDVHRYTLDSSAQMLPGVGPRRTKLFARILGLEGIPTLGDLLSLYPRDYEDRRRISTIRELRHGAQATFFAQITGSPVDRRTGTGKTVTQVPVSDGSGVAQLCWFNQPYIKNKLQRGVRYIITGKVERYGPEVRITQPDMEPMAEERALSGGRIVPVYPLTEGLQQAVVRVAVRAALDAVRDQAPELLPPWVLKSWGLPGIRDALENIHFPGSPEALESARRRLKFEELFLIQTLLAMRRQQARSQPAIRLTIDEPIAQEIRRMVPFEPTGAQKRVVREIFGDLVRPAPMNRLLQGDVGSGKTIVAAIAVVAAVRNGCQVALMAPTEILAEQHAATFSRLLDPLGIPVWLLTGSVTGRERDSVLNSLAQGDPCVVIGTHALIQDGVQFSRLALVIVDEQHRFGVDQRLRLQQQGASGEGPHALVMTATPIPRTLSLTAYGDLDVSVINELPPGRTPIKTCWKPHHRRKEVYEFVQSQVAMGRQAYVVCPLIEDSDKVAVASAITWRDILQNKVFPDLRVGLVHGRLRSSEKDQVMDAFRRGEIHILAATTVIEVGVDVPNATVMVIEDANRFGLAQLHQLRGRIGRGQHEGYCFLVTDEQFDPSVRRPGKLALADEDESDIGRQRMAILVESADGFRIAEADFELRGIGVYFGTQQHGRSRQLRIADLRRDFVIVQEARDAAFKLIEKDPRMERPEHARLRDRVADLHVEFDISEDYSSVA